MVCFLDHIETSPSQSTHVEKAGALSLEDSVFISTNFYLVRAVHLAKEIQDTSEDVRKRFLEAKGWKHSCAVHPLLEAWALR